MESDMGTAVVFHWLSKVRPQRESLSQAKVPGQTHTSRLWSGTQTWTNHRDSHWPVLAHACSVASVVSNSSPPYVDCSPPGSSVHGILQARILAWIAMPSSKGIFPTQGLNLCLLRLLHWQAGSLPLAPPGKPPTCSQTTWAEREKGWFLKGRVRCYG